MKGGLSMARRFSGNYKNPYLKDVQVSDEASYQLDVLLDEARTRKVGTIKAKKGAFELQRARLLSAHSEGMKPDSGRFDLDIDEDLNGGKVTPEMLEKMSYSPSYRPSGKVGEQISDFTVSRLRYSALSGRKARAPKDLYFLKDPAARDSFDKVKERDGRLRRSSVRNEIPVEKRRAELIEMLPKEQQEKFEDIAREVNEHREKRDTAQGRVIEPKKHRKRYDDEDLSMFAEQMQLYDPTEDFRRRELDERSREEKLPESSGLDTYSPQLPQMYSETRHWSRIDSDEPTWSEIQQNTETEVIGAKPKRDIAPTNSGRYIPDEQFDPKNRYKQQSGIEPRRMPKLESYDDMKAISVNPYTLDCVLSPDEIEKIMKDDFRSPGQLSLPEEISDPKLRGVWNSTYGARYGKADVQKTTMPNTQSNRRRRHKRSEQPRVHYANHPSAYREPIAQGYAQGRAEADRIRREDEKRQKIIEENERRLAAERQRKAFEEQRRADAQRWAKEQEEYRRRMSGQMPPQAPPANHEPPRNSGQAQTTKRWNMQQQAQAAWQSQQAQYTRSRQGHNFPPSNAPKGKR